MIDESRKPFLRQVWKDHNPQDWHKLVGTLITRQEWSFLCDMWESSKKKPERPIINPVASGEVSVDDIDRLTKELG